MRRWLPLIALAVVTAAAGTVWAAHGGYTVDRWTGQVDGDTLTIDEVVGADGREWALDTPLTATEKTVTVSPPDTVPSDCSQDVTNQLQTWIDGQPDGATLDFTGDCYRIDGTLRLDDRSDLTLQGGTFRAVSEGDASRKQWELYRSTRITFTDMTVEGVNHDGLSFRADPQHPDREGQHNFAVRNGNSHIVLDGVTARHAWGDCFMFGAHGADAPAISDIVVRNSTCESNGRMGLAVNYGQRFTIDSNHFNDIAWSIIDMEVEGDGWHVTDVTISNNTFGQHTHSAITGPVPHHPVTDVLIVGNTMLRQPQYCHSPVHSRGGPDKNARRWTVRGNTFITRHEAVDLVDGRDHLVEDNDLHVGTADCSADTYGLDGTGSTGVYRNNVLHGFDHEGAGLGGWDVSGNEMR